MMPNLGGLFPGKREVQPSELAVKPARGVSRATP